MARFLESLRYIVLGAVLFLPAIVQGEPKAGDRFGDWVFECKALAEGKTACMLTQTIATQKDNQRIVKFSLARNEKKDSLMLNALLPLGIHLPSGVSGTIDQGKPFQYTLETCIHPGCIATYPVDSSFVKALQGGQKLNINFTVGGGKKPISINGSLKGLADGIKATNIN